jgi:hypothetical protein
MREEGRLYFSGGNTPQSDIMGSHGLSTWPRYTAMK